MIKLKKMFLKEKPSNIILTLGIKSPQNILSICKKTDIIYAYTLNILKDLEENDIVYSEKSGRERFYRLTDQGKQIYTYLSEFVDNLDKIEFGEARMSVEEKKIEEYRKKIEELRGQLQKEDIEGIHSSQKLGALLEQLEKIETQL
ncbi:MAG: winged helix-turn-helix domain-containing protein [Candidatus Methanofastidiosia archaeon]